GHTGGVSNGATGGLVRTLTGHVDGFAQSVAFSIDGSILASGSSSSREIILWGGATGQELNRSDQETGWGLDPTSSIAFSPLGTTFGYARNDATVSVANLP